MTKKPQNKKVDKVVNIASKLRYDHNEWGIELFLKGNYPQILDSVKFDEFTGKFIIKGALPWYIETQKARVWTKADTIELRKLCHKEGVKVRLEQVHSAIEQFTLRNRYHPVRNYLERLKWDGNLRLDTWLQDYCGAIGDPYYLMLVGSRYLISAVARIYKPGCKVDTMLILEGPQGLGKSSVLKTLAVNEDYFTDSIYNLENKDIFELIRGKWIVEIPELDAFKGIRVSMLKQFLSSSVDSYRKPYEIDKVEQPRQCVFAATTNETEYLKDETGNRRFWPVACSSGLDADKLARDVGQLWAEAVFRYKNGEKWWLERGKESEVAEREQAARIEHDSWADKVEEFLDSQFAQGCRIVSIEEILTNDEGFGFMINGITRGDRNRVKACAESLDKYIYTQVMVRGKRIRGFITKKVVKR